MEKAMKKASLWTAKSKGREASADDRPWNTFGFLQAFAEEIVAAGYEDGRKTFHFWEPSLVEKWSQINSSDGAECRPVIVRLAEHKRSPLPLHGGRREFRAADLEASSGR